MAQQHSYEVLRRLDGDKVYEPGDTREMTEADAKHLVDLGCLRKAPADMAAKSAPPPEDKAEPALHNKAATPARAKRQKTGA